MSESDIQNVIMEYLTLKKIGSFERINNLPSYNVKQGHYMRPSRYAKKGVCDIIGCLNGRFVGIEVKSPIEFNHVCTLWNKISHIVDTYKPINKKEEHMLGQIRYITDKNRHGGYCFFTHSLDHVIAKLNMEFK